MDEIFHLGIFVIGIILLVTIVIMFALGCYWNIKYLSISRKEDFCWIKLNIAIASALMSMAYAIVLILSFTSLSGAFSFGGFIVRPPMAYMSFMVASAARSRYVKKSQEVKLLGEKGDFKLNSQ